MSTDVNVKVAVRCRPMSSRETQMGAQPIVRVSDGTTIVIQAAAIDENSSTGESSAASSDHSSTRKQFTFDHAYGSDSVQSQVYDDIARPTVEKALQGYNGTIFAYGQTGSGKTHTMMGSGDDHGIIPLMNLDIFERVGAAQRADPALKFLVTVSFLEIYNEVIKDLLNPSDKVLKIREHPDMGIYVEQLAELIVKDAHEVARLLQQGNKVRQVAATQMNERSSRSHSCFTIKIASKRQEVISGVQKEIMMNAKINLVDLAGSERASKTGATGDRLKEGAAINKSLSALGNVINMLAASDKGAKGKSTHVPYRDSKLTRLLQESLGGNSLTVMVAAISPADYNYDESMSTLLYANRAKSIKNATKKNEDVNEKIIRELREEIERLRQMVRPSSSQGQSASSSEMTVQMEETIANLERAKQQSWEEKQRLTELYEQERFNNLTNEKKILGFMQTVKQEKMDIMKRVKALQQRKLQTTKQLRQKKHSYLQHKSQLQADVETFQQQQADTTLLPSEKKRLMESIESCKTLVIEDRDEMVRLKDELKLCEDKLVEEEAEVAAKSALLEEDDKLRKAIQDDEREKMKQERAVYLQAALEDERRQFQQEAEDDKQRLHLALEATIDKEKKLLEEVENQRQKAMTFQQQLHETQVQHAEWRRETKAKMSELVARLKQDFVAETQAMDEKYAYVVELLRNARDDIVELSTRNEELEKKIHDMICWEKTW
uniref:Kinesin-like protein n=1 Tax=Globisporangium ultimum (strain ATCC 200006 / CBS 805.95 / DAOM BR144) TaxID=431595 RepID=K3X6A3_GLOUD